MTLARRFALYGAAIGGFAGLVRSLMEGAAKVQAYVPQTEAGVVANHIGYAFGWAAFGAMIGYAIGYRRQRSVSPPVVVTPLLDTSSPRTQTTPWERLGHVLGWTGNALAIPLLALGTYSFRQSEGDPFVKGVVIAAGILAFLIGQALRYILAGPRR